MSNNQQKSILNYFNKSNVVINKPVSDQKNIISFFKSVTSTPINTENKNEENNSIICFTDGACINNGKRNAKGSWAAVFPYHMDYTISGKLNDGLVATNNRAEYTALIKALEQCNKIDPNNRKSCTIYSDSELLIKSVTKWLKGWKKNNWKKKDGNIVLNRDLLETIDYYMSKRNIFMFHVRSHTGKQDFKSIWNDKADLLAKEAL